MAGIAAGEAVRAGRRLTTDRPLRAPGRGTGHRDGGAFVHGGGGGRPGPRGWPMWAAIVVAVLLAAVLTLAGMVAQILANLAGSQLPGA